MWHCVASASARPIATRVLALARPGTSILRALSSAAESVNGDDGGGEGGGGRHRRSRALSGQAARWDKAEQRLAMAENLPPARTIFVRHLPKGITETEFSALFADCGAVETIRLRHHGNRRGAWGWLTFADEAARAAALALDGTLRPAGQSTNTPPLEVQPPARFRSMERVRGGHYRLLLARRPAPPPAQVVAAVQQLRRAKQVTSKKEGDIAIRALGHAGRPFLALEVGR